MAQGQLSVDAFGPDNKTVIDRGKLMVVDNQIDQATGTIKLKAEFPNADLQLWPGQFVNVQLLVDTLKQVVVVSTAAVQRGPNGPFVFVIKDDNTVSMRPVTITQQDEGQSVIATGLQSGERVVTTGFNRWPTARGSAFPARPAPRPRALRFTSAEEITSVTMTAPRNPASRRATRNAEPSGRGPARRHERAERFRALHPPPDRDLAARRCGAAGRRCSAISQLPVSSLPQVDFPTDPGHDAASGRQPGDDGDARHRAARTPVRPDPGAGDDDVAELVRASARSRCSSTSTATSTPPRRTCRPRSTRRARPLPHNLPYPPIYSKVNPADAPILTLALTSRHAARCGSCQRSRRHAAAQRLAEVDRRRPCHGAGRHAPGGAHPGRSGAARGLRPRARGRAHARSPAPTSTGPKGSLDGAQPVLHHRRQRPARRRRRPTTTLVIAYRNGAPVRLTDVANVVDGARERPRSAAGTTASRR